MRTFKSPPTKPAPASKPEREAAEEVGSNLWLTLTAIPRPSRKVPFPRYLPGTKEPVGEVAIWPLTPAELIESNAAAEEHLKTLFKDISKDELNHGYDNSFVNELALQQLWRACRDPDSEKLSKHAFPSPKAMRMNLTGDEIGVLYNHYLTVQVELAPITSHMTDAEYEALVRRIAEDGNADPFASLSLDLQRTLVVSLASHLASSWKDTSSVGLPREELTSKSSDESTSESSESSSGNAGGEE